MTEVWKSVPKKFCEICKCWFYDNKVSIEHHERGQRHQEGVKKKLRDLGKKGRQQEHEEREKRMALLQMERGAMAAYKRDVKTDQYTASTYNAYTNIAVTPTVATPSNSKRPRIDETVTANLPSTSALPATSWCELKTVGDDGTEVAYFWNIQTGETTWELPEGAECITLAQEGATIAKVISTGNAPSTVVNVAESIAKNETKIDKEEKGSIGSRMDVKNSKKKAPSSSKQKATKERRTAINIGSVKGDYASDAKKADPPTLDALTKIVPVEVSIQGQPYGDWQPVQREERRRDEFAYLPHNRWIKDEPSIKSQDGDSFSGGADEEEDAKTKITFAERTLPLDSNIKQSTSSCTFKKRKAPSSGRNIRNRDD